MKNIFVLIPAFLFLISCSTAPVKKNGYPEGGDFPGKLSVVIAQGRHLALEPCGCSMGPMGGLKREWNLIGTWKKETSEPLLYLGAGTTFVPVRAEYRALDNERYLKEAEFLVEGLNNLGVTAISPTAEDLSLGIQGVKKLEPLAKFSLISSNLFQKSTGKNLFAPYMELEYRGGSILIMGVSDVPDASYALAEDVEIRDPALSLKSILTSLQSKTRLVVLLSNLSADKRRKLQSDIPELNLILGGALAEHTVMVYQYGRTHLFLNPVEQGRQLARIDFELPPGFQGFFDVDNVPLIKRMKAGWEKEFQEVETMLSKTKLRNKDKGNLIERREILSEKLRQIGQIPVEEDRTLGVFRSRQQYLNSAFEAMDNPMSALIQRFKMTLRGPEE